jgi:hypothetical protein
MQSHRVAKAIVIAYRTLAIAVLTIGVGVNSAWAGSGQPSGLKFTSISTDVVVQPVPARPGHPHQSFTLPRPAESAPIAINQSQPSTEPTTPTTSPLPPPSPESEGSAAPPSAMEAPLGDSSLGNSGQGPTAHFQPAPHSLVHRPLIITQSFECMHGCETYWRQCRTTPNPAEGQCQSYPSCCDLYYRSCTGCCRNGNSPDVCTTDAFPQ